MDAFQRWLTSQMVTRGLTQAQVARAVRVDSSAVSHWATGKDRPRPEKVTALAELFGEDRNLVLDLAGYGSHQRTTPAPEPDEFAAIQAQLARLRRRLAARELSAGASAGIVQSDTAIPTVAPIVAASSAAAIAALKRWRDSMEAGDLGLITVVGDWLSPHVRDGQRVVVAVDRQPALGDYVLAEVANQLLVGRLVMRGDQPAVAPLNGQANGHVPADSVLAVIVGNVTPWGARNGGA